LEQSTFYRYFTFVPAGLASLNFCLLACTFITLFSSGSGRTEFYSHTCIKPCSLAATLNENFLNIQKT
jgi:hypothetical protein